MLSGGCCAEPLDEAGTRFTELVSAFGNVLPQTFSECYSQDTGHTWVSNLGGLHRNDYIGLPLD